MKGFTPPKPTGFNAEARFDQSTWDKEHGPESGLNGGPGVRVNRGSRGSKIILPKGTVPPDSFYPFRIYQFPSGARRFRNADDWRRFKVHGGGIYSQSGLISFPIVYGTDGVGSGFGKEANQYDRFYGLIDGSQVPPDDGSEVVPGLLGYGIGGWNEVSIPVGDEYAFWVNLIAPDGSGGMIPAICAGEDPSSCLNLATGDTFADAWPAFPINDPYHYLVGYVLVTDTPALFDGQTVMPQQLRSTNLEIPAPYGGGAGHAVVLRDLGTYDAAIHYFPGDMVSKVTGAAGNTWLKQWVYNPTSVSAFYAGALFAPLIGVDPETNSPDPWILKSSSPLNVDYHTDGAYQAAKAYLRTA